MPVTEQTSRNYERTAGASTASLAMKLRKAPLRIDTSSNRQSLMPPVDWCHPGRGVDGAVVDAICSCSLSSSDVRLIILREGL